MAPVSHRQAEALAQHAQLHPIVLSAADLLDRTSAAARAASAAIHLEMTEGRDVLLIAGGGELLGAADSRRLPVELGTLLRPFGSVAGALIATGGETASAILEAWGIQRLQLFAEVETGMPCSRTLGLDHNLTVITKSGTFGNAQSLIHAYDFLTKQKVSV